MLRIPKWLTWQSEALKAIKRKRAFNGTDPLKSYSMSHFAVSVTLGRSFQLFAGAVGGECAEGLWLRVLQYVAIHDAFSGDLPVSRDAFGAVVLSRSWDPVGPSRGRRVYDALIHAGLAVPWDVPGDAAGTGPPDVPRNGQMPEMPSPKPSRTRRPKGRPPLDAEAQREIARTWEDEARRRGGTATISSVLKGGLDGGGT